MGKLAQGNNIIKLFPGEKIIKGLILKENEIKDLILITNRGTFIKHNTDKISLSKKGELGTMGINVKEKKRVINSFINNEYVYIKTNKDRYEQIDSNKISLDPYKKEKSLDMELNEDEFITSIFSMISPENS